MNIDNLYQNFQKNVLKIGIKRKQPIFARFIETYKKRTVVLKPDVLKQKLVKITDGLKSWKFAGNRPLFDKLFDLFGKTLNSKFYLGKIIPDSFTNYTAANFIQPEIIFISHDIQQRQAVSQAKKVGIKVVGFNNISRGYKIYDLCAILNNFSMQSW